jgi:hypothetical protein
MAPTTKFSYEKKFKPWRKGESAKAKLSSSIGAGNPKPKSGGKGRSLKNQLRGSERFLAKLLRDNQNDAEMDTKTKELIQSVKRDIESLKEKIRSKEEVLRETQLAAK